MASWAILQLRVQKNSCTFRKFDIQKLRSAVPKKLLHELDSNQDKNT